ncbi:hypothetical protein [uncultured Algibacter sp.]|uniref:hypothetical protein n=1 Tax=uncultured Algibacter sp. TaxID=298659 RepID=UPI002618630F|nr:hypothetical protein [uncultured Algibacter sp.]
MNQLQKSLRINAYFSGISGIILIIFNKQFADLLGISTSPFWITGLVLIFFMGTIIYEIKKQRRLAILWIITQDLIWVSTSLFILIAKPFGITRAGHYIIGFIALIVLLLGMNQIIALQNEQKTS